MGKPPKRPTGPMTEAERARAYRKRHNKRIGRSRKKQRNEANRQALQIAAVVQHNTREAEMAAAAERAGFVGEG